MCQDEPWMLVVWCGRQSGSSLRFPKCFDVQFERLIVLSLDLQLGLEFFYEQFQPQDFRAEFLQVVRGRSSSSLGGQGSGLRRCRGSRRSGGAR